MLHVHESLQGSVIFMKCWKSQGGNEFHSGKWKQERRVERSREAGGGVG